MFDTWSGPGISTEGAACFMASCLVLFRPIPDGTAPRCRAGCIRSLHCRQWSPDLRGSDRWTTRASSKDERADVRDLTRARPGGISKGCRERETSGGCHRQMRGVRSQTRRARQRWHLQKPQSGLAAGCIYGDSRSTTRRGWTWLPLRIPETATGAWLGDPPVPRPCQRRHADEDEPSQGVSRPRQPPCLVERRSPHRAP
jgi:hypothetical protein